MLGWVRHAAVLVAGYLAGSRGISGISAWRTWHHLAGRDPSAAELYQTAAMLDLGVVVISLALAALVWWLVRPARAP